MPKASTREEHRERLLRQGLPWIRLHGFKNIKVSTLTKQMGVSKVTFYKYFDDVEDLINAIVLSLTQFITSETIVAAPMFEDYVVQFNHSLITTFELASFISAKFQTDLAKVYHAASQRLTQAIQQREQKLLMFYTVGKQLGFIDATNLNLVLNKDRLMIPHLVNINLNQEQSTIHQLIRDYYGMTVRELFTSSQQDRIVVSDFEKLNAQLSAKIALNFRQLK